MLLFAASVSFTGGCGAVTRVATPDVLLPGALANASGAASLRVAAVGQFANGLSNQVVASGLLSDELTLSPTAADLSGDFPEDLLASKPTDGQYPFSTLSTARLDALAAIGALEQYAATPAWHIAELYALNAATEIMFSENLCNGVSLGTESGFLPAYGPTYTRNGLLAKALSDLDSAAKYSAASDSISALAEVLRSRALLDSGQIAAAAAAASAVPVGFAYTAAFDSATNITNQLYNYIVQGSDMTVSDREGINGLPFVSAADPRLPLVALTTGDSTIYVPAADNSPSAPITLASGVEAQLIVAEGALAAGQITTWASTLNALRSTAITPPMMPLPPDSTTLASGALQQAVMFRERAFWLFGTGHRQGDLRRLVRQYGLPEASVFPTGPYHGGPLAYGTTVVMFPASDANNPNYKGCIDTNP